MVNSKVFILQIIILFSLFVGVSTISNINFNLEDTTADIRMSEESSLAYGNFIDVQISISEFLGKPLDVFWEFSGSNPDVGITVYAMSYEEYLKYRVGYFYSKTILSDGSHIKDSGIFKPSRADTWVIIFLNQDSSQETTVLTYNWKTQNPFLAPMLFLMIFAVIIGVIIATIVGVTIYVRYKRSRST
ncbi:MAG: hypothetical protein P8Y70_03240 [Candidatus Lokiarchaeota archaeon]